MNFRYIVVSLLLIVCSFWLGRSVFPERKISLIEPDALNTHSRTQENQIAKEKQVIQNESTLKARSIENVTNLSKVEKVEEFNFDEVIAENERLKEEITSLKKQGERDKKEITKITERYIDAQTSLIAAEMELSVNGLSVIKLSLEQIKEIIPSPFADGLASLPTSKKELAKYAQEERDIEWAVAMEQRISDFIVTHELSYAVELVKVECKSTACQIAGFDTEEDNFPKIIDSLREEPWFELPFATSYSNTSEGRKTFYSIIKKNMSF
jgi:hypothetical protein